MKRLCIFVLCLTILFPSVFAAPAPPELVSPCAILIEKETGNILFAKDEHKQLPPASVTKVMTLLLVVEAINSGKITLEDPVSVSEHAAGMGGSQVFLSPGEQMSVNDMLKATVIASGNDSAVALAEHIAGSEESFVGLMNERAKQLGMNDTSFKNCTGLDVDGHVTSAHDIALMARELIKHDLIKNYTTIWMDTLRDGAFQLANTNKLIRSYKGITGLKTGSTSVAKFCLATTAERDGMELIAAILAAPSSKERFSDASKLLDYGFANYTIYNAATDTELSPLPVVLGKKESVIVDFGNTPSVLAEKSNISNIVHETDIPENVKAPVQQGQKVGTLKIISSGNVISEVPIIATETVERLEITGIFTEILSGILMR